MSNHENFGNQSGDYVGYNNDFEPFNPERAREEQERRKFNQLVVDSAQQLTEDAKNKLLSRGVVAGEDPLQFYCDLRKSELISDAEIADYIKSVKTPAEALRDGYHGLDSGQDAWSMACNAQFNLSFSKMDETTMMHSKRILEMFSGGDFNKPNNADANSYKAFLQRYPSALDFDVDSEAFLSKIGLVGEPLNSEGSKAKRAEYARDMAAFKKAMYGEQQSRLDAMKYLDNLSSRYGRLTQDVRMLDEMQKRALEADDSSYEVERADVSCGVFEMSKSAVRGEKDGRESEDATFVDINNGVFALFDGAGGSGNGRLASQCALETIGQLCRNEATKNGIDLQRTMRVIDEKVAQNANGGQTTGVIIKIEETDDGKELNFASIGDSRLYIMRGDNVYQMTNDDNVTEEMLDQYGIFEPTRRKQLLEHGISKSLGGSRGEISDGNYGVVKLEEGDRIVVCSDGVSGDVESDRMSNEDMASILRQCQDDQEAAQALVQIAKKNDDRSAIVISINNTPQGVQSDQDVAENKESVISREKESDGPVETSLKHSNILPRGYQIVSGGYENERALYRDWKNFLDELGYTSRRLEDGNYYCVKDDNNY